MELEDLLPLLQLYGVTSYKDKQYDIELKLLQGIPVLDEADEGDFEVELKEIEFKN